MIKVGIVITTYNLEKYISEALESILNQKTNYEYKIIIADDCSQDNTISILYHYKEQYGDKIELVLSDKNMGSLKNSNRVFNRLDCEYFSFLDGDDYWIGDNRLQRQVDFLDAHPEYMMCAGNTQYLRNGQPSNLVINPQNTNKTYSFSDLLADIIPFVHTSSILVRNSIFINGLPDCFLNVEDTFENCALRGEDFRRIIHLEKGPMFIMDEVVSVYRIHPKGMWQGSSKVRKIIEHAISMNFYRKYFYNKYDEYFSHKAKIAYRDMMISLIVDYEFLSQCKLSVEDTYLLSSLLQDLSVHDSSLIDERDNLRKKISKKILKVFF